MPKIPEYYSAGSDPVIQSFSYTDIAEGTGIVQFNLCNTQELTTVTPFLTTSTMRGNEIVLNQTWTALYAAATKVVDLDFDVHFNISQKIKGTAYLEFIWGLYISNTYNGTAYTVAKLRKYDGSTETEIASATSETISIAGGGQEVQKSTMKIPVTTQVNINRGEILRLTIEQWVTKNNALGSGDVFIGTDPTNQDTTFHTLDVDPTT